MTKLEVHFQENACLGLGIRHRMLGPGRTDEDFHVQHATFLVYRARARSKNLSGLEGLPQEGNVKKHVPNKERVAACRRSIADSEDFDPEDLFPGWEFRVSDKYDEDMPYPFQKGRRRPRSSASKVCKCLPLAPCSGPSPPLGRVILRYFTRYVTLRVIAFVGSSSSLQKQTFNSTLLHA